MAQLFNMLEIPDFTDMTDEQADAACVAWENWAYDIVISFSDDEWDEVVGIMRTNRDRYYAKYRSWK